VIQNLYIKNPWGDEKIPRHKLLTDIDFLKNILQNNYSYFTLNDSTALNIIDQIRDSISNDLSRGEFALQVHKLLTSFSDPHTIITNLKWTEGSLPFIISKVDDVYLAVKESGIVYCKDYPIVIAVDAIPISEWHQSSKHLQKQGSTQFSSLSSAFAMTRVNQINLNRGQIHLKDYAIVTLSDLHGNIKKEKVYLISSSSSENPPALEGKFEDSCAFLKINSMREDPSILDELRQFLEKSRTASGLVVDLRGNSGGSRHILHILAEFFLDEKQAIITNVLRYKLKPNEEQAKVEGYLEDRFSFPETSSKFSTTELEVIRDFKKDFEPEWTPSFGSFSSNHYLIVKGGHQTTSFKDKPVVILQDTYCGSATDILLGSLKGLPNVTLIGQPSTGASGRAEGYELKNSGLKIRASSVISYQKSGLLFDRRGVLPDINISKTVEEYVRGIDLEIQCARRIINEKALA
jgi:Peptidase family S41